MAFMFIVTIIVIAICRVHVKRTISHCLATNTNLAFPRGSNVSGNQLNGFPFYDLDLCFNRSGLNGNDLRSVNPLLVAYNINNGVQFVGRPVDPPPYCEIVTSPPKEGPPPPYASHEDLTARRGDKVEEPRPEGREEILEVEAEVTESDALLGATSQSVNVSSSYAIDIVPCVAEDISNAEILDEPEVRSGRIVENILKESSDTVVKSDSSHCDAGVNKIGDNSKNSAVDIVVLGGRDQIAAEDLERIKVQNGESSSYVSGGVSDISKGAVKKIISVKSVDGNSKKKAKTLSKSHFTKF